MTEYASIEKYLPLVVKAELSQSAETERQLFADEFGKKKKSLFIAYLCFFLLLAHRWYLGKPGMMVLQWISVSMLVGILWVLADLFMLPKYGPRKE